MNTPGEDAFSLKQLEQLLAGNGYLRYDRAIQQALALMDDDVQHVFKPGRLPQITASVEASLPVFAWQPHYYEEISKNSFAVQKDNFNSWARYYEHIAAANTTIFHIEDAGGIQADRDQLAGEAYALRAYYYFMLVNLYAQPYTAQTENSPGVPLILTPDYIEGGIKRSSVKEVYQQITADIEMAVSLLQDQNRAVDVYRINATSAHFIASKIYLHTGNWQQVVKHSDAVLVRNSNLMQLSAWGAPDPEQKAITSAFNIETIWAFGSPDDFRMLDEESFCPSDELVSLFDTADLRKGIYLVELTAQDAAERGYIYVNGKRSQSGTTPQSGSNFRVAEAYLNRAEAYAQLSRQTGSSDYAQLSVADLNTLRRSRFSAVGFTTLTAGDANSLIDSCRVERRRELFGEDQRWFDLRRYGMPGLAHRTYGDTQSSGTIFLLMDRDPQYTWAIPESAIKLNPLLVQNPLVRERMAISLLNEIFW